MPMWNGPQVGQGAVGPQAESVRDDVAERAIGFAQKYGTGLSPSVYQVWYTYSARSNRGINDALDLAMNTGQAISGNYIAALYHEHLSGQSEADELDKIGSGLFTAIGAVSEVMDEGIASNSSFSGTLKSARQTLVHGTSKREVSDVITQLHKANQQHLQAAQRLNVQLEKSRGQVSKLKTEMIEMRKSSNTDYLTGLPNRRRLDEILDGLIFDCRQKNQNLAVLMCVIDNLEAVTQKYGISTGDTITKLFADQLKSDLRGHEQVAARFAGERFALVLPGANREASFEIAEHARTRFQTLDWVSKETGEQIGVLSITVGGTLLREGDDRASLIDRVGRLLYRAQTEGRGVP